MPRRRSRYYRQLLPRVQLRKKKLENLKQAIIDLNIPYPVAQDNERATWGAYKNRYWPTLYLIDKRGRIRYTHIGEGRYDETETAIQALLAESYP